MVWTNNNTVSVVRNNNKKLELSNGAFGWKDLIWANDYLESFEIHPMIPKSN